MFFNGLTATALSIGTSPGETVSVALSKYTSFKC